MQVEMVFNELSARAGAQSIHEARQWMKELVHTMREAAGQGVARTLRTKNDFHDLSLAPQYSVRVWRNDREVDLEERRYLINLSLKSPYLDGVNDSTLANRSLLSEFRFNDLLAEGLGFAFLFESLAISLPSGPAWENHVIAISFCWLEEEGNLTGSEERVQHASQARHIDIHSQWISERQRQSIRDGDDLFARGEELFPSLIFCGETKRQLRALAGGDPHFKQVVKRLFEFQGYCREWSVGPFEPGRLPSKVTQETQETLKQYSSQRTFVCPDGQTRVFSWHARMTPFEWRLHFDPDEGQRRIRIGYIGPHLPTKKFHS